MKLRNIGDTALLTASLDALRETYPKARIDALVPAHCRSALEFSPSVNAVHSIPREEELVDALWRLRREKYDLLLGFHATASLCRWAWLLGAPERVLHHHSRFKTPFWSTRPIANPGMLQDALRRDFEVLSALGISPGAAAPRLVVPPELRAASWVSRFRGVAPEARWVALVPGAREMTRRYPRDLWLRVLDGVNRLGGVKVVVLADAALSRDWDLPDRCRALGVPLRDDLSLSQLVVELSACDAMVGNDSGPFHLAAALGLRTVCLFGPGCAGDWHPYEPERHRMLRKPVDCRLQGPRDNELFRYCTVTECSHLSCLRGIQPAEVMAALEQVLAARTGRSFTLDPEAPGRDAVL